MLKMKQLKRWKKMFKKLRQKPSFNAIASSAVAVTLVVLGYFVFHSRAATPAASINVGSATVACPAAKVNDSTATGGVAVQFGNNKSCTQPPSVAIANPKSGDTINGTFSVAISVTNYVAGQPVKLFIDGLTLVGNGDNSNCFGFWCVNLDTTKYSNTSHILTGVSYDATGKQYSSANVTVNFNNPVATNACAPSVTSNAKVGNTRGGLVGFANGYRYGELSSSDRDRYMNVISDEGAKWYRMNMEGWNMTEYKDVVARAKPRGLCIVGNISANSSGTHWADPPNHQAWANAAANEVSQLKADVHVWEIWNEENNNPFWPGGNNPSSYADLLHRTYVAIKAVDPNAIVLLGGNAPCGNPTNNCSYGLNAINYLKGVYNWNKSQGRSGSTQLFDGIAHHPYYYPNDPTKSTDPGNAFYQTVLLHQVMSDPNYGGVTNDGAKRIWGTEGGFPTNPNGDQCSGCQTISTAAGFIGPMLNEWITTWGAFTGPFMYYQVQDQPIPNSPASNHELYMGFIFSNWSQKNPQYSTLKSYDAQSP